MYQMQDASTLPVRVLKPGSALEQDEITPSRAEQAADPEAPASDADVVTTLGVDVLEGTEIGVVTTPPRHMLPA